MANRIELILEEAMEITKMETKNDVQLNTIKKRLCKLFSRLFRLGLRSENIIIYTCQVSSKDRKEISRCKLYFAGLNSSEIDPYIKSLFLINQKYNLISYSYKVINPSKKLQKWF